MNIVIIPATEQEHINLALNLAIGIRSNDRTQQTLLLHAIPIPEEQVPLMERYFDYRVLVHADDINLLKLKAQYYTQAFIANFILLDVSTMITPGKKLSDLFELLQRQDFTCYNNDDYHFDTGKRSRKDYTFHCDLNEAKLHFGLSHKVPQIKSTFIYFKNNDRAKTLFDTAIGVWNSSFFSTFKTIKTSEACLNIACSLTGIYPHQTPYLPVFWQNVASLKNEEYIYHQYPLFEVDTKEPQSERVVVMYNKVADYYRKINGIEEQQHFKSIVPVTENRKVFGFYHVCAVNHFKVIVKEQVELMVSSGLYNEAEAIFVGCVGPKENMLAVKKLLSKYPKFKILSHKEDLKLYEFPTLRLVESKSAQEKPFFGFYLHTKGVTFPNKPHRAGGDHWRGYLNKYNISAWRDNLTNLKAGNDLSGATWISEGDFKRHYRGNFWWFNSDYTKRLPAIDTLKLTDRFQAEFWCGLKNPMIASLADLQIDYENRVPY